MTHAVGRYGIVMAGAVAAAAWLLTLVLGGSGAADAIVISAVVAAVVQLGAFTLTRALLPSNMAAAWGAGALLRFVALVVYGLVAVKVVGLPPVPALVSLFVFFFLSMLLEPLFLRR